jgi:3-dehydroquinate synthase
MKTYRILGKNGDSIIQIGAGFDNLSGFPGGTKNFILTDHNIDRLYGRRFPQVAGVITIGTGEAVKTLETVRGIYEKLIALEADRSAFLLGIGGGIVCDIAGFAAATYLRGIRFALVPTTLLAQIDAAIGGKNGVNFHGFKNMVGTFRQPEFVLSDIAFLKTLPGREVRSGLAEMVKHAVIADPAMFSFLEKNWRAALALDPEVMEKLVHDAVVVKADVVNLDETETGERRKLNFGHTLGHAVEKTTGVPHGEAVSIGMIAASRLSVGLGLLPPADLERIEALLIKLELPVRLPSNLEKLLQALKKDKKREGEMIRFVLLKRIGETVIEEIPIEKLQSTIEGLPPSRESLKNRAESRT